MIPSSLSCVMVENKKPPLQRGRGTTRSVVEGANTVTCQAEERKSRL